MEKETDLNEIPRLKFKDSIHEQREFKNRVIPAEGDWLEVGEFIPVIEKFNIKERWQCVEREVVKDDLIKVVLKKRNFELQQERVRGVAGKIIKKHGDLLTHSLLRAIVHGAHNSKESIQTYMDRIESETDEKYKEKREKAINKKFLNKLKDERNKIDKQIKETEVELNEQKNNK